MGMTTAFYGTDVRRMRLREVRRFVPKGQGTLVWLLMRTGLARPEVKLNMRCPQMWAETLCTWDDLRPVDRDVVRPRADALIACGYVGVAVHRSIEPMAGIESGGGYLLHSSGTSFAFVANVTSAEAGTSMSVTAIGTPLVDGRLVGTSDQRATLDDPTTDAVFVAAQSSDEVARAHAKRLPRYAGRIQPITDVATLARVVDTMTVRQFEERVARGVYVVGRPAPPPGVWASAS